MTHNYFKSAIHVLLLLLMSIVSSTHVQAQNITTIAGTGQQGYSGDGGLAINAQLSNPYGVVVDGSGNIYIADISNTRIRKVDTLGIITTVAGKGVVGYSGDNGPATNAELKYPQSIAVDHIGNLYIADSENNRIRKVDTNGIITTVAGTGEYGYTGDNGPASNAKIGHVYRISVDGSGNLYIADSYHTIRKVDTNGIITTIAGNGQQGYSGDGGLAINAQLSNPYGAVLDGSGNIYIADLSNSRIRKVDTYGIITTVAGTGVDGYSGDGGAATSGQINKPRSITIDKSGNIYIADVDNNRIRKIDTNGIITTVVGNGQSGYSGDGDIATNASLSTHTGIAFDAAGNLYIADTKNQRIRKVAFPQSDNANLTSLTLSAGTLSPAFSTETYNYSVTVANAVSSISVTPTVEQFDAKVTVNGTPVTNSTASSAIELNVGNNNITVVVTAEDDSTTKTYTINVTRSANSAPSLASIENKTVNELATLSFTATATDSDGDTLIYSLIEAPTGAGIDSSSGFFSWTPTKEQGYGVYTLKIRVTDSGIPALYAEEEINIMVEPLLRITTYAGTGTSGYNSDGGLATSSQLDAPTGITTDRAGNLYIADTRNHRIRKVDTNGKITAVAGTGAEGYSGDGGPATNAQLDLPSDVAIDKEGNIYVADAGNDRIRKISTDGIITTIAGTGVYGFSGDGGPVTSAQFRNPYSVAVDGLGNIFIADFNNNRVRKVDTNGIVSTVAGKSEYGFDGDGGPATDALLFSPRDITVDSIGNFYIVDYHNSRIRKVDTSGIITTVIGSGTITFGGDGGPATSGHLYFPYGVDIDRLGNFYISDYNNKRIRKVNTLGIITTIAGTGTAGHSGDGGLSIYSQINNSHAIAADDSGNVYIADTENHRIRKISVATALNNANLSTLNISSGTLSPSFNTDSVNYLINVANAVSSVAVTPTVEHTNATVSVNGNTTASGNTSSAVPLKVGSNTILVVVTAQDGTTTRTYTLNVVRNKNNAPVLASIDSMTVNELDTINFIASAKDNDEKQKIAYSLINAPTGARINDTTGEFSWAPSQDQGPGYFTFSIRATDNGTPALFDEQNITITVTEVTKAAELKKNQVAVYPNPTAGQIAIAISNLDNNKEIAIRMTSLDGRTLVSTLGKLKAVTDQLNTNLSEAPAGMYILHLTVDKEVHVVKIVKQ
jgi:sugar lactone lactonase YvrE